MPQYVDAQAACKHAKTDIPKCKQPANPPDKIKQILFERPKKIQSTAT
jgi:hypothetical protein